MWRMCALQGQKHFKCVFSVTAKDPIWSLENLLQHFIVYKIHTIGFCVTFAVIILSTLYAFACFSALTLALLKGQFSVVQMQSNFSLYSPACYCYIIFKITKIWIFYFFLNLLMLKVKFVFKSQFNPCIQCIFPMFLLYILIMCYIQYEILLCLDLKII